MRFEVVTACKLCSSRQAARRMAQGIFRAIREGNLRVVHPEPKAPFKPRMELYNNPDSPNIVATFELPGVKISDLSISAKEGLLLIYGERRAQYIPHGHPVRGHSQGQAEAGDMNVDSPTSSATHARLFPLEELRYGKFHRVIRLPPGADTSCINASLSDGLLTVSWPRSPLALKHLDEASSQKPASIERPTSSVRMEPLGTGANCTRIPQ
ncbi:SHSP domain-containing protein [Mycena venus]|uniref:SHSP domain-containing protein n=1 Tax=Mycena venus TaxID=2733690 RepID=A0A8H6Z7I6_9AGAR|nr:SHSP domain-containing protein [Mycena venus]